MKEHRIRLLTFFLGIQNLVYIVLLNPDEDVCYFRKSNLYNNLSHILSEMILNRIFRDYYKLSYFICVAYHLLVFFSCLLISTNRIELILVLTYP